MEPPNDTGNFVLVPLLVWVIQEKSIGHEHDTQGEGFIPGENKCRRRVPWTHASPWESSYSVLGPDR
jgi:hypothetical protein